MNLNVDFSIYKYVVFGTVAIAIYTCVLAFKRLYLSPICRFPGPRLAAFTFWYEFYYDCVLGGQYMYKVDELHKKYGNIIRVNPLELHIRDPDFHSELYSGPGRKRDIDSWFTNQFGIEESHFATLNHDLHRDRRAALAPFFSMASVRTLQPVIEERVQKLIERMRGSKAKGEVLEFDMVFSALTNDIIQEFSFSRHENFLEAADFGIQNTVMLLMGTKRGHLMKHLPLLRRFIEIAPERFAVMIMPAYGAFAALKKGIAEQIQVVQRRKSDSTWSTNHKTIFSELLDSKLPASEKSASRLSGEGRVLLQAGTQTTARTLSVAFFYLLSQPSTLRKLRQELAIAIPDPDLPVPLIQLEKLPYLTACIKEALRLGIGSSARLPRIPTEETLVFTDKINGKQWSIPPGTKCSMTAHQILLNPDCFASPQSFRPERWIEDKQRRLEKYYVPFSKGTRACLGMNLAYGELYLTLANLFRSFGGPGSETGSEGIFKLWETEESDVVMAGDFFVPFPREGSKGVRVVIV